MMRRLFWLSVGAGLGGFAVRRTRQVVTAYSPPGAVSVLGAARRFLAEVRTGTALREAELRAGLGLTAPGRHREIEGRRTDADR